MCTNGFSIVSTEMMKKKVVYSRRKKREIIMQHDLDIFFIYDKRTLSFALWDFALGVILKPPRQLRGRG